VDVSKSINLSTTRAARDAVDRSIDRARDDTSARDDGDGGDDDGDDGSRRDDARRARRGGIVLREGARERRDWISIADARRTRATDD